ncbi:hypothetical protein PAXRUDRAFT_825609 [Paxillus rubicundulus Ve08.2h10]|uniref:Unplaced genomic scaffold scaffold_147, whole genome shotgun sequence n=1 Tax=Paxillus rubicundulus Ve08.2h10 TaxID=930991 RepID=A0A0D0DG25_9AGAM|nr:hypothetical protein PAXRUDRAFT_825609 [Paxillus rubicundulus Ve08.2h10]
MSDNVDDVCATVCNDPPSPSPSPDANECTEQTLPRKREREVSLEPATPKTAVALHASDVKSPAKRGRVHLDTTLEEDPVDVQSRSRSRTPSHPHSPALSVSPPHEVKVRQISQGVEDMKWQQSLPHQDEPESLDTEAEISSDKEHEIEATQVDLAEELIQVPPSSFTSNEDAAEEAEAEAEDMASSLPYTRRASESDGPEKVLKRKLADRGTSQGPENLPSTAIASIETAKRPRDDSDKDDNPRVPKRPSPPPEQEDKPSLAPETSTPKPGGFMAYASAASPFASVKGQNVFSGASPNNQFKKPPTSPSPTPSSLPIVTHTPFSSRFTQSPFAALSLSSPHTSLNQTPHSTAIKRTGFEAFVGSASPFAPASPISHTRSKSPFGNSSAKNTVLGRSKSPPRRVKMGMNPSPFSPYASGGVQAFSVPHPKRVRADSLNGGSSGGSLERKDESPLSLFRSSVSGEGSGSGEEEGTGNGDREDSDPPPSTFGEKLRASKDGEEELSEEEKERLTEQEVVTGEEEEETIHQVRGKLYTLCSQNQWKERGTGQLRLNVRRIDGGGARLVMRKEAVYTLLLNVTLFQGMRCFLAQDPRYIRFSVFEDGKTVHYNVRVSNAKIAMELLEEINANIPS